MQVNYLNSFFFQLTLTHNKSATVIKHEFVSIKGPWWALNGM